jgi:ceroid-lipofuscinosis MFS transporter 7
MAIMATCVLLTVRTKFEDPPKKSVKKKSTVEAGDCPPSPSSDPRSWSNSPVFMGMSRFTLMILFCFLLNVTSKGSISIYETLTVKMSLHFFPDMGESATGYLVSGSGLVGVLILLCFSFLTKVFSDIALITGGLAVMVASTALLLGLDGGMLSRFETAIFLTYAIGYPIGHTAVIGMFSKITSSRPQGALQGYFASAGSLARMSFPVITGYIINVWIDGVWWWICTMVTVSIVAVLLLKGTLKRLSEE